MAFTHSLKIRFKHCDPAGIVFYPRYFEMINDTVETFFENVLHYPFAQVVQGNGVPTAQIEARFIAPSRLGDDLDIVLGITRLGRSSLDLGYDAYCGTEQRFIATSTLVFVDGNGRSTPWDGRVRDILKHHLKGEN